LKVIPEKILINYKKMKLTENHQRGINAIAVVLEKSKFDRIKVFKIKKHKYQKNEK